EAESTERLQAIDARYDPQIKAQQARAANARAQAGKMRHDKLGQAQMGQWAGKPLEERTAFEEDLARQQAEEAAAHDQVEQLRREKEAAVAREKARRQETLDKIMDDQVGRLEQVEQLGQTQPGEAGSP